MHLGYVYIYIYIAIHVKWVGADDATCTQSNFRFAKYTEKKKRKETIKTSKKENHNSCVCVPDYII